MASESHLHGRCSGVVAAVLTMLALPSTALAAPPPNDNFANAEVLSGLPVSTTGTNVDATAESGEPDHGGSFAFHSVWYSWTAPASGRVTVETCGSSFTTLLVVYTGTSVGALTKVAGDGPFSGGPGCSFSQSRVPFTATSGQTYRIAVDGFAGTTGSIRLALLVTTQCSDDVDNDGDGAIDYRTDGTWPADPGCSSSEDNDETDPPPPPPPLPPPPPPEPPCPVPAAPPGPVYSGTHGGGGLMCLTVSSDWSTVTSYLVKQVRGLGCTVVWQWGVVSIPIVNKAFSAFRSSVSISGSFSERSATGTFQLGGGNCVSPLMSWSASTTASPPWLDSAATQAPANKECKAAKAKVKKAKKRLQRAKTASAKKKAKKQLKKATRRVRAVC